MTKSLTRPLRMQLKALEQLQELDLKIDQLKRGCGDLPAVLKDLEAKVAKIQSELAARTQVQSECEKNLRQNQAAQEMNKDRIARSASKLENVSNSQEYQAATKEVDQLKKLELTLAEQAVQIQSEIEKIQKECESIQLRLKEAVAAKDEKASSVDSQVSDLTGQIAALTAERLPFSEQVDKPLLSQYERIRPARGGLGIVPSVGGRCKGCNMVVAPQMNNELARGDVLHQCPSCFRILYFPGTSGQ